MSKPQNPTPETSASADQLALWTSAIHIGLGLRKNGATEAETRRLAKTLQRLQGAASQAMTHHPASGANPSSGETFIETLDRLSRA